MARSQRIRDPIHDLVEFKLDRFEQMAWALLNAPEFQRLRRIKQLGFSELVFPGATHTRFAHSVGVFHTARLLSAVIGKLQDLNADRAEVAMAAALVHDLGHGPFSHAFESAMKKLGRTLEHEDWTAKIVEGDTAIAGILEAHKPGFRSDVAKVIASDTPQDIYASIVSSQFDADRLDYVRRDRLMAGVLHGNFDFSWLLANLEVDKVFIGRDGEAIGEVEALILGRKALQAAESYVLGLFHLYGAVYFHKTTRSAEKMLTAIIERLGQLIKDGKIPETGLEDKHPLVRFLKNEELSAYLELDDFVIWGSLTPLSNCDDQILKELASRLRKRDLYKAIDINARLQSTGGEAAIARFRKSLYDAKKEGRFGPFDMFEDTPRRDPYKRRAFDTPDALSKVLIRKADGTSYEDLRDCSDVVKALQPMSLFRIYVRNDETKNAVESLIN